MPGKPEPGCGFPQPSSVKYNDFINTSKSFYYEEGIRAFGKGILPRMGMNIPAVAMSWGTYEMVKNALIGHGSSHE
jgi:hypothetical protein